MTKPKYRVPHLSPAEKKLVAQLNTKWKKPKALKELKKNLQVAIEVELATIPIYLYTYYSINRTIGNSAKPTGFPNNPVARFADKAGAVIMSVAVEEMLHMSLASNVLYALGQDPQVYGKSPGPYPTGLPKHARLGPDCKKLAIPLAKFSADHLWSFLEIEYPAKIDAPPEDKHWETIGQIYSYIRCIICTDHIEDSDFKVRDTDHQIQPTNYSPNSIDTVYPDAEFQKNNPVPAPVAGSAATVAKYASREDGHLGRAQLLTVSTRHEALQAIGTICFQGEGFAHTDVDDPSGDELSHYYKFLTLQSELWGYPLSKKDEPLPKLPKPPPAAATQFNGEDLSTFVCNFPQNPVAAQYTGGYKDVVDVCSGLYQYMLIMTETIFRVPSEEQKVYFNQTMHMSMIWILDKFIQSMRKISVQGGVLAPTFENLDLGTRAEAFANLSALANKVSKENGGQAWYDDSGVDGYVQMIPDLPDVSIYWAAPPYLGAPRFPSSPPETLPEGVVRHACMGLNHCKDQGRTLDNDCAGQGWCSTALQYNPSNVSEPLVSDHTCHVMNDCKQQGGCGLYGTVKELDEPGYNDCRSLGSCATPINASRFITDGPKRGDSVWLRAREVFHKKTWPTLRKANPSLPKKLPAPGAGLDPNPFEYGPTIEWIQNYSGEGMTACGSSGMSGAGSCA